MTPVRYPLGADEPDAPRSPAGPTTSGRRKTVRKYDPRSIASPGQGLADLYPALYKQAVRCPKYPELPIARLVPRSNLILVWRCQCSNETLRKVNNVTSRGRVGCDRCQSAGKSRLEYEIAELLRAGMGADVLTHHGLRRHEQVDLYLPAFDTAIEIDPYTTHRDRADKDRRRLEHHAARYAHVFRVREERLPVIDGCPTVPARAHPLQWASTIAAEVAAADWIELTPGEVRIAVETGAAAYFDLIQTPPSPSLAQRPEIARDFVSNLDVPNQSPEWIPVGSGALCLWSCPNGHTHYPAPVDRRTGPQATGCPRCGAERAADARRRPPPGGSAADLRPEIVDFFIDNLSSPGRDLGQLRPGSHDQCRWRCARLECTNTLKDTVKGRAARPRAVCGDCRSRRLWETRRENPEDPTSLRWQAALRALDDHITGLGHARIHASYQSHDGFRLGAWVLQTRKRRASLTPSQLHDLAARPQWVWGAKDDAWWRTYALLKQFADREGHTRVPRGHEEAGVRLDAFTAKQRQRFDQQVLTSDRVAALQSLPGWVWRSRRRRSDVGQRRQGRWAASSTSRA